MLAAGLAGAAFAGSAMTFGFRLSDLPPDAFRAPPAPLWTLLPAVVMLSVVAGVLALAWPGATVLVLAILLGIRTLFFGLAEIAFALTLRQFSRA